MFFFIRIGLQETFWVMVYNLFCSGVWQLQISRWQYVSYAKLRQSSTC